MATRGPSHLPPFFSLLLDKTTLIPPQCNTPFLFSASHSAHFLLLENDVERGQVSKSNLKQIWTRLLSYSLIGKPFHRAGVIVRCSLHQCIDRMHLEKIISILSTYLSLSLSLSLYIYIYIYIYIYPSFVLSIYFHIYLSINMNRPR